MFSIRSHSSVIPFNLYISMTMCYVGPFDVKEFKAAFAVVSQGRSAIDVGQVK